jgi:aryl-alcohol dehydrogenase-like predicted oxidoreductase
VIPALRHYGIGLIPWSPLGGGLLGGVLKKIEGGRRTTPHMQEIIDRHRPQLEAYEALCAEIGKQPADIALAWLLNNPALTATIVGPRTADQLAKNLNAPKVALSEDTLRRLDEIWPGPGGEAPEAYAW